MGLNRRPKTNRKFDGSKLIIDNMGVKTNIVKDVIDKYVAPPDPPEAMPSSTVTPSITQTPSITPTNTQTPSIAATSTVTPSITPTKTPTNSIAATQTPTTTPTKSLTPTITSTKTPTNTKTPTTTPAPPQPSKSQTPTITPTNSITPTITPTKSIPPTKTPTNSITPTITPTNTITKTNTPTNTITKTNTSTNTQTPTNTQTVSPSFVGVTPSVTPSNTKTPTVTPSITKSPTKTPTQTKTPTVTRTQAPGASPTRTNTQTPTPTGTITKTPTPTKTPRAPFPCNCYGITFITVSFPVESFVSWRDCDGNQQSRQITSNDGSTPVLFICGSPPLIVSSNSSFENYGDCSNGQSCPSGPPSSPTPSITQQVSPTNTRTPSQTPTITKTVTPTPESPTPTPTITETPTITPTTTMTNSPGSSATPTTTITPTPNLSASATPTITPTPQSPTPTPTITSTPTITPTLSITPNCIPPSSPTFWISSGITYNPPVTGSIIWSTDNNLNNVCNLWKTKYQSESNLYSILQTQIVASPSFIQLDPPNQSTVYLVGGSCSCQIPDGTYAYNLLNSSQQLTSTSTIGAVLIQSCKIVRIVSCTDIIIESPTPTQTSTITPTPTQTVTVTSSPPSGSLSPTPTVTATVTPTPNGVVARCLAIYNYSNRIFAYDQISNTSTELFNIPNIPSSSNDIAHTANKMFMINGTNIREYNITTFPNNFTATFVNDHPVVGFTIGRGLCAINNTTVIITNDSPGPFQVYEFNILTDTATPKFPIYLNRRVTGDYLLTTTGKFIVLVDNQQSNVDPSRQQWIQQYNYSTGDFEGEINITPTILSAGGYAWAMYQQNGNIYIAGSSTPFDGVSNNKWQYQVSLNEPYTLTSVPAPSLPMWGASQIPDCVTVNLNICTPPTNPLNIVLVAKVQFNIASSIYGNAGGLVNNYEQSNSTLACAVWSNAKSHYSTYGVGSILPTTLNMTYGGVINVDTRIFSSDGQSCNCGFANGFYIINTNTPSSLPTLNDNSPFSVINVVNCVITEINSCSSTVSLTPTPTPTITPTVTSPCVVPIDNLTTVYYTNTLWSCPDPPNGVGCSSIIFGDNSVSDIDACDYYYNTRNSWQANPTWSVIEGTLNIHNFNLEAAVAGLGGQYGRIYIVDSNTCDCSPFNQQTKFWINRVDPTQPLNNNDGVYLVTTDGNCNIVSVVDCDPSAEQLGIKILSVADQTMTIRGTKENFDTGLWGSVDWNDGQSNEVQIIQANSTFGVPSLAWAAARSYKGEFAAYLQLTIPQYVLDGYKTYTFERIKGFLTTPFGLSYFTTGNFVFNNCYFTSINNVNFSSVSSFTMTNHNVVISIDSTTTPSNGFSNPKSDLKVLQFGGTSTSTIAPGSATGNVQSVDLNISEYPNLYYVKIWNHEILTGVTLTFQTTMTYISVSAATATQSPYVIEIGGNPALKILNLNNLGTLSESNPSNPVWTKITISDNPQLIGSFSAGIPSRCAQLSITRNSFTQISSAFPSGNYLKNVYLNENKLTSISSSISSSTGIDRLWVQDNALTSLPTLPNSITELRCENNGGGNYLVITGGLTSLPSSLPSQIRKLVIGSIDRTAGYQNNNFTNFFTIGAGRPSNYFSNTQMVTFIAHSCGISEIDLQFPSTIRIIDFTNSLIVFDPTPQALITFANGRQNNFFSFDCSKCSDVTSLIFKANSFLNTLTNLDSCSNIQTLDLNSCNFTNVESIFGVGNGISIISNIITFSLETNNPGNGLNFTGWDTFDFSGLNNNGVTLNFTQSALNSASIDAIINNLYTNYFNTSTNTVTKNSWTIRFGNTGNADDTSNCNRTSSSSVAYNALTNSLMPGAWTIRICGQPGQNVCRTIGC